MAELQWRSLADTSRERYFNTWRQWCKLCARHHVSRWLPRYDPDGQSLQLIVFAIECWKTGEDANHLRVDTVRAKLSHLRWCHHLVAGFSPVLQPQHELVLQGMRRLSAPRRQRAAVTIDMLQVIATASNTSVAQHRVICGAAVLGYFFCLRGSEYFSSRGKRHGYCLQVRDVRVQDVNGSVTGDFKTASSVQIKLRGSKTDQNGQSITRTMLKSGQAPVCPVFAALLQRHQAQVVTNGPAVHVQAPSSTVIQHHDQGLKGGSNTLQGRSQRDLNAFSWCNSTTGINADTIRMHGRWASDAYRAYIHDAPASTLQLAKRMGQAATRTAYQPDHPSGAARTLASARSRR